MFVTAVPPSQYAVVDVETTGLDPRRNRVVQIAVALLDPEGRLERQWHTLVNPRQDPGPVHVHGLTREQLAAAPLFAEVAPRLNQLLAGRVLVAHNADFDYSFLAAEAARARHRLPTTHRLCTIDLARSLAVPVPDFRLSSLAEHYGITQQRAHDARDDTRVLAEVFTRLLAGSRARGVRPQLLACQGAAGWVTWRWRNHVRPAARTVRRKAKRLWRTRAFRRTRALRRTRSLRRPAQVSRPPR